ncbi:MAG: glycoside hydrolase family 88 protein [Lachnospiraceae bacterium]|nr:glycoside hydrolase family 88 protein [Lachnospiraceae bacterium]
MNYKKAITEEAVRLLNISDAPDLYHLIRRWARVHIKHETVAPVDVISWPKGCLMYGLMHVAKTLQKADNSMDRAISVLATASVQEYLDRWIKAEAPLYTVDDALASVSLLYIAEIYEKEDPELYSRYMKTAGGVMHFLKCHETDEEGALPYRPAQKTGQIFADSIGMVVPFAIRYGLMKQDDDAIDLGMKQITCAMEHLIDEETHLPWHVYSIKNGRTETYGSPDWGRSLGWIMFGIGSAAEAFTEYPPKTVVALRARDRLLSALDDLADTAASYRRPDGLFGSRISDNSSPIDTSASAMIIYGIMQRDKAVRKDDPAETAESSETIGTTETAESLSPLLKYINSHGEVGQAQGECMGIGIYSDNYGSYPWSVGMTMTLI